MAAAAPRSLLVLLQVLGLALAQIVSSAATRVPGSWVQGLGLRIQESWGTGLPAPHPLLTPPSRRGQLRTGRGADTSEGAYCVRIAAG